MNSDFSKLDADGHYSEFGGEAQSQRIGTDLHPQKGLKNFSF
jgi:hypothetical protein